MAMLGKVISAAGIAISIAVLYEVTLKNNKSGQENNIAQINRPKNDTRVKKIGDMHWNLIKSPTGAQSGDTVFTGENSSTTINLKDGTEIIMAQNSILVIKDSEPELEGGSISLNISPRSKIKKIKIAGKTYNIDKPGKLVAILDNEKKESKVEFIAAEASAPVALKSEEEIAIEEKLPKIQPPIKPKNKIISARTPILPVIEKLAIEEKKIEIPPVIEAPKIETEEVKLRENKLWLGIELFNRKISESSSLGKVSIDEPLYPAVFGTYNYHYKNYEFSSHVKVAFVLDPKYSFPMEKNFEQTVGRHFENSPSLLPYLKFSYNELNSIGINAREEEQEYTNGAWLAGAGLRYQIRENLNLEGSLQKLLSISNANDSLDKSNEGMKFDLKIEKETQKFMYGLGGQYYSFGSGVKTTSTTLRANFGYRFK